MKIPNQYAEELEFSGLVVKGKPFSDKENLLPICNRCFNTSPLLSDKNECSTCLHPFIQSFVSFECLPLVEFKVDSDLSPSQVMKLLKQNETNSQNNQAKNQWTERIYNSNQQSITLNQNEEKIEEDSPFIEKLNEICDTQLTSEKYICLKLPKEVLATLDLQEVHIQDLRKYCPTMPVKYFKNLVPEISLINYKWCARFFDEYEFEFLKSKKCPFCKRLDPRAKLDEELFS